MYIYIYRGFLQFKLFCDSMAFQKTSMIPDFNLFFFLDSFSHTVLNAAQIILLYTHEMGGRE